MQVQIDVFFEKLHFYLHKVKKGLILGEKCAQQRGAPVESGTSLGSLLGGPWGPSGGARQSWGVRSGHFKAHWGRMGLNKGAPGRAGTDFGCI